MKNIFFDLCSIPLYLLILWTCAIRGMTRGRANRTFITMSCMSLLCAVADLWMEFVVNPLPLSHGAVVLGTALSYTYKFVRNATLVVYFIYIFRVTRTEYRLRSLRSRLFLWLPNILLILLLLQNLFTHNVFSVTEQGGYARGPMLTLFYVVALSYAIVGVSYCVYCKRYLIVSKWTALISVYILTFLGVFIQLIRPHYAVEMFSTAIGLTMILLLIMRPEETLDGAGLVQDWKAYQANLTASLKSGRRFQIVVVQIMNALEIRRYLGDRQFQNYIHEIAEEIDGLYNGLRVHMDLYFEIPGSFYLILDSAKPDATAFVPNFTETMSRRLGKYADQGVRFEPKLCVIRCPEDLGDLEDILSLGHSFTNLGSHDQTVFRAKELKGLYNYAVTNHMKDILNRAITEQTLEMYYQPIYDMKQKRFRSAEALARIVDPQYGMISPALFIPAAESAGLIVPIGEKILESVYRFIAQTDLEGLGISFVEINLSVAQCLQKDLPEKIQALQRRYGIDPRQVNFEVTETLFDNLGDVMDKNLRQLARMGYSFSLDDYGVGYSNIQRLRTLPLRIIKIDKSLVDDMFTTDGEVIIENTVHMMQGIHKELVVEGVETEEALRACDALDCDYIQGYYYSKPLPAEAFVAFVKAHNLTLPDRS